MLACAFHHSAGQVIDDSLSSTVEVCPLIEHLMLSSCLSIDITGLSNQGRKEAHVQNSKRRDFYWHMQERETLLSLGS